MTNKRKKQQELPPTELIMLIFSTYYKARPLSDKQAQNRLSVLHDIMKGYYSIYEGAKRIVRLDNLLYSDDESLEPFLKKKEWELRILLKLLCKALRGHCQRQERLGIETNYISLEKYNNVRKKA